MASANPRLWRSRNDYETEAEALAAISEAEGLDPATLEADHTDKSWRFKLTEAAAEAAPATVKHAPASSELRKKIQAVLNLAEQEQVSPAVRHKLQLALNCCA